MGLISAAITTAAGVLNDQWKEYFYCDSLSDDVLAVRGIKKTSGFSGNRGNDNVISDGSVIAVADGQCMLIVEQGKVVDVCAETGEYIYDMSSEPSVFTGDLGDAVYKLFEQIGKRFTFGGEPAKDQRVYFFNTKEIVGNKYGTPNAIPFRVIDRNVGLDVDIGIRCFGEYSFRMTNPILFYTNVCGNVASAYTRSQLESQMKTELLSALQPAFAKISEEGIRYSAIAAHTTELANALNEALSPKWKSLRGIEIVSCGVSSVTASEEDEKMIKQFQMNAALKDPAMAAAHLTTAQAAAMQDAANNAAGAAAGFIGMNMASAAGGMNAASLYDLAAKQNASAPAQSGAWFCASCGTENHGNFCTECGAKKPAAGASYRCSKCGWTPENPAKPPKFCPECGDPFDSSDIAE